jgi:lipoate-protein ligase A
LNIPPPVFFVLSPQVDAAAENMAADWLLLESFPEPQAARLRFYGWARPSFTFGYGQKWRAVRAVCPDEGDLIRRPTGGGLVDHRTDWTYALVLPPVHPLALARACESYRAIHEALAGALREMGVSCRLQPEDCGQPASQPARETLAICFQQAETFDVVRTDDGRKIAGAAQKRTRHGLLFQGSVNRAAARELKDGGKLAEVFAQRLGARLGAMPHSYKNAPWAASLAAETTARFQAKEWNEKR